MGDDMTNQKAIKIVEDMIESMNDIDVLYAYEQDALNQLIKTTKKYDEFDELCTRIGGHGGYMISTKELRMALEQNS